MSLSYLFRFNVSAQNQEISGFFKRICMKKLSDAGHDLLEGPTPGWWIYKMYDTSVGCKDDCSPAYENSKKHQAVVGMLLWLKVSKRKQTTDEQGLTTNIDHHVFAKRKGSWKVSIFDHQQSYANTFWWYMYTCVFPGIYIYIFIYLFI